MTSNIQQKQMRFFVRIPLPASPRANQLTRSIFAVSVAITASHLSCPCLAMDQAVADATNSAKTFHNFPTKPATPEGYRLGMGDHVRIRFFDRYDRDDLNGEYIIGDDDRLKLPRIGPFDVRNRSVAELEQDIRQTFEAKGEKLGFFTIDVVLHRSFYVTGFVNHAGPYAFLPGLSVAHAISLAGGLYRSPMATMADAMREKRTLVEMTSRIAELLGHRARLQAEREASESISIPQELVELEPKRSAEIISGERLVLERSRQLFLREKLGLEELVAIKSKEVDSYEREIVRLGQRIDEQTKIHNQLKKLHEDKIINQQRFLETVIALDGLQRDKQVAVTGLSQTKTDLEKGQRDLALLKLAKNARIEKELADVVQEITRLKRVAAQTREMATGLDMLANQSTLAMVATYKITRTDGEGQVHVFQANESTPILPGDLIDIGIHPEKGQYWLSQ